VASSAAAGVASSAAAGVASLAAAGVASSAAAGVASSAAAGVKKIEFMSFYQGHRVGDVVQVIGAKQEYMSCKGYSGKIMNIMKRNHFHFYIEMDNNALRAEGITTFIFSIEMSLYCKKTTNFCVL
jgi:hypothetical protein